MIWIRIRIQGNDTDSTDPDPQHCIALTGQELKKEFALVTQQVEELKLEQVQTMETILQVIIGNAYRQFHSLHRRCWLLRNRELGAPGFWDVKSRSGLWIYTDEKKNCVDIFCDKKNRLPEPP